MRASSWILAVSLFSSSLALAGDPQGDAAKRKRAGEAFDAAVQHANHAEYDDAAKGFLLADDLAPSSVALSNAMAAARKANNDLLTARAAQRAIDRADTDPKLATAAREALLDVEHRVVRLELSCDPKPCTLKLDDEKANAGKLYVLPGTHKATAEAAGGATATEKLTLNAGGQYHVVLYPTSPTAAAKAADVKNDAPASSASAAPTAPPPPTTTAATSAPTSTAPDDSKKKPLPPAVVYVGGGLTAVLAGVMIWSGTNTLSAKSDYTSAAVRTSSAHDTVKSDALRTDILLGATVLVGVATAVVAVTLVDWGGGSAQAGLAPNGVTLSGKF